MTATIGPVELSGAHRVQDEGGWDAPEQAVDRDFDFQSYNQAEPVQVTIEAVVTEDELETLRDLRDETDPFGASVGSTEMSEAFLQDLRIEEDADMRSHVRATITIRQVFTAEIETSELVIEVPDGTASGSDDTGSDVSLVSNEGDDTGASEPPDDSTDDETGQAPTDGGDDTDDADDSDGGLLSGAMSMMSKVSPF